MKEVMRRLDRPAADEVPADIEDFLRWLGGPCWIDCPGEDRGRRRVVATLLHGNEPSGLRAVHAYLRSDRVPAVDAVLYIASVEAALGPPLFGCRMLPGHRDMNRCFAPPFDGLEGARAEAFLRALGEQPVEALVDLHNNTGQNPAYGVGCGVSAARLNITGLFGDFFVDSDIQLATLVDHAQAHCPSVTIECGRAGDPAADAAALSGLERFLSVASLRLEAAPPAQMMVLSSPVRIHLADGVAVQFADTPQPGVDLTLEHDIDRHNFGVLPAGSTIGWVRDGAPWPLLALGPEGPDGGDLSRAMFVIRGGRLTTTRDMIPVMMTTSPDAARQDCLFYAMAAQAAAVSPG